AGRCPSLFRRLHWLARRRLRRRSAKKKDRSAAAEQNSQDENDYISHVFSFYCDGLGLVTGDTVGDAVGDGGGGAVFMFCNNALSTAATVFVTAFTCALTCDSGTLFMPAGISKRLGSTLV